ncbi:MAG TPA: hypothetical protein VHO70_05270, partial [Chitinispirillaceae bacterium]|nr:hypothetical protein [Chitinispirillaceae bacterium]
MMNYFKNLSIRIKIFSGMAFSFILLGLMGSINLYNSDKIKNIQQKFGVVYLPKTDFLDQADRDLFQLQVAERSLLQLDTSSDQFNKMIEYYNENL